MMRSMIVLVLKIQGDEGEDDDYNAEAQGAADYSGDEGEGEDEAKDQVEARTRTRTNAYDNAYVVVDGVGDATEVRNADGGDEDPDADVGITESSMRRPPLPLGVPETLS